MTYLFMVVLLSSLVLVGSLELALITAGTLISLFKGTKKTLHPPGSIKTAILIPAHNEEMHIETTLKSLIESAKRASSKPSIIVIVDNSNDRTLEIAGSMENVQTLERNDLLRRGKQYALSYAFNELFPEKFELYIIVDADSTVSTHFVSTIQQAILGGDDAVQTDYQLETPSNTLLNRFLSIAFVAFNRLRPVARQALGFSSGFLGNGFALTDKLLKEVPFETDSIVEDVSYHIKIVEKGYRVVFLPGARVIANAPPNIKGVTEQRQRWEMGRFREAYRLTPRLLKQIFLGKGQLIEPLLDLWLLPLSYFLLCVILLFLFTYSKEQFLTIVASLLLVCHLFIAAMMTKKPLQSLFTLLLSPVFLIYKGYILVKILINPQLAFVWNRTKRK